MGGEGGIGLGEFFKGPARNLSDDIVDGGLEACQGFPGDVVAQFVEAIADSQFCGNFGDWEAGGFACQGAGAGDPWIHLNGNHIAIGGVDGKLNIAATRGDTNIKSDTLTVTYADVKQPDGTTKTDATDIDAQGNVTITTPKEVITGDWAKYDPQTEKLVVGGNVKLVQGTTVLLGNELVSDLKTDRTQMKGGRVKGSFLPK